MWKIEKHFLNRYFPEPVDQTAFRLKYKLVCKRGKVNYLCQVLRSMSKSVALTAMSNSTVNVLNPKSFRRWCRCGTMPIGKSTG